MVKRSAKYGVNSGNRLPSARQRLRDGEHQACITRQVSVCSPFPTGQGKSREVVNNLPEFDVNEDNVIYSLNKKGRWQLPQLLKDHIHSDEVREQDIKVSLVEHHKLKRQANCVSYHASKGEKTSIIPNKGYFDQSSINNTKDSKTKSKKRRHKSQDQSTVQNDSETAETSVEITYEAFFPCPEKSFVAYSPKYQAIFGNLEELRNRKCNVNNKHRSRLTTAEYLNTHVLDDWDYFDLQEESEENSGDLQEFTHVSGNDRSFADILDHALKVNQSKNVTGETQRKRKHQNTACLASESQRRITTSQYGKGCAIYLNKCFPRKIRKKHSGRRSRMKRRSIKKRPLVEQHVCDFNVRVTKTCILMLSECVSSCFLDMDFGTRYFEALCNPRKFCIYITLESAKSHSGKQVMFGTDSMWSWLVFAHAGYHGDGLEMFNVYLNSEFDAGVRFAETLTHMKAYTPKELYQHALEFVVKCCQGVMVDDIPAVMCATMPQPLVTLDLLESLKGWKHETYHRSQSYRIMMERSRKDCFEQIETVETRPVTCDICCEQINPCDQPLNDLMTSLRSCNHWQCNQCWGDHLNTLISQGFCRLQCLEVDCRAEVDPATALSLIPARQCKKFIQWQHDIFIQHHMESFKWCPNPKCGRVLVRKDSSDALMCLTCDCGLSVCFQCLEEAHWPATCQQTKEHKAQLRRNRHEAVLQEYEPDAGVLVRVKFCPRCKEAIEKNFGCPLMTCVCGYTFCWSCMTEWVKHTSWLDCHKGNDSYNTLKRYLRKEPKIADDDRDTHTSYLYDIALEYHRRQMNCQRKKLLKDGIQIKSILKTADLGKAAANSSCSAAQTLDSLIQDVIRLLPQMYFLIEHTAVLLEYGSCGSRTHRIYQLLLRMDFICSRFHRILEAGVPACRQTLLARLQNLYSCGMASVQELATVIR